MSDTEITIPQDVMLDDSRPPQSFPRADLYAQIAAKRRREMDIEESAAVDEAIADPVDSAPEADPQEAAPEPPVYLKDGRWVTRRKVNGTEEEVDFDRLLAHDQKLAAADQRLAEASRMRREAEEALARAQTLSQQQPVPVPPPEERNALARKYHQALLDGDDEAADDLLLQINGTVTTPPVDLSKVEAIAERRVQQTLEERDRREAVARFKRDFPAVAADTYLWDLADRLTMDVMAEGTQTGLYEIMAEAGRRATERVMQAAQHLGAKPAPASSPTTPMETRRAAKAAAGRPVAGLSATAPAKPEPRPPTPSERIAQMQAARRGAVS